MQCMSAEPDNVCGFCVCCCCWYWVWSGNPPCSCSCSCYIGGHILRSPPPSQFHLLTITTMSTNIIVTKIIFTCWCRVWSQHAAAAAPPWREDILRSSQSQSFKTLSMSVTWQYFCFKKFQGFSWDYDKAVWIDSPWSIAGGEIHLIALVGQSEEGLRPDSQCGLDFTQVRHNKPVLHQNARQFKSIRIESDLNFYQSNQPLSPFICHSIAWKWPQT